MADNKSINWIPNLSGKIHHEADQAIRYIFGALYDLRDGKAAGSKPPTPNKVGGDIIGTIDNALLIRKGPGAGVYTGFTKITLDDNGRVIGIS